MNETVENPRPATATTAGKTVSGMSGKGPPSGYGPSAIRAGMATSGQKRLLMCHPFVARLLEDD